MRSSAVCICTCKCVHKCVSICVWVGMCVWCECMRVSIYVWVSEYVCSCMNVCGSVMWMQVYECIWEYECMSIHVHVCMYVGNFVRLYDQCKAMYSGRTKPEVWFLRRVRLGGRHIGPHVQDMLRSPVETCQEMLFHLGHSGSFMCLDHPTCFILNSSFSSMSFRIGLAELLIPELPSMTLRLSQVL